MAKRQEMSQKTTPENAGFNDFEYLTFGIVIANDNCSASDSPGLHRANNGLKALAAGNRPAPMNINILRIPRVKL